jgi:membrane protease YdiL (CAAX protease family)
LEILLRRETMDLKRLFTRRVNLLFGVGCFLPAIISFSSFLSDVFLVMFHEWDRGEYWLGFVLPQLVCPIASALLFLLVYKAEGFKVKDAVRTEKSGIVSYIICVPAIIFVSTVLSMIVWYVFDLLSSLGINLPTVSSSIPTPSNIVESIALIVVMAVIPALCEEFIYRFTFIGMLSPLSRGGAIVISSFAFGLMHGTLEQIFFAFGLGICMSFIYVYTGNYRLPIVIHFVNNFISCASIILGVYLPEDAYYKFYGIITNVIFVLGAISMGILLFRKKPSLQRDALQMGTGDALILAFKAPFFWLFTVAYVGITIASTF